ncbi:Ig-like domain-containing protein [Halanaerobaculum tunisiense]
MAVIGGVDLGNLTNYLFFFADANQDANWQGATKGYVGDVAVDGIQADERTSGDVPYAGTISTNDNTLGAWQQIVDQNLLQASAATNQNTLISNLEDDLISSFQQINALSVTAGFENVSSTSLDGLNTQNGTDEVFVINVTSGLNFSSKINITGDAGDVFILRWDTDGDLTNGYQGQVKPQSGGAIVPQGDLEPGNFINVAGDINASGGGTTPAPPYPQGPRFDDGQGALINGGSNFDGGGFFTGYWLTTGAPTNFDPGTGLFTGETQSLSNGIFVGGWYTLTTKFSMTSGTSGVYVSPNPATLEANTPPSVDKTPPSGSLVSGTVPIEVTASDDECLDRVELFIDGTLVETVVDNGSGDDDPDANEINFTFDWDTTTLSDGEHIVLARAIDCAGDQTDDVNQYIVDNTLPIVNIDSPPDGSIVNDITPIEVSSTDNECLDRVELYIDGDLVFTQSVAPGTETNFIFDWDTTAVANGPHTIETVAIDCAGNEATDQIQLIVDNEPPVVNIDSPPDGSIVNDITPIEVSSTDNECLDRVELYIDGDLVFTQLVAPGTGTTFTFDWNTTIEDDGPHNIKAVAVDCAGNEVTDEIQLIVDNELPEVSIDNPPDGSFVTGTIPIDVSGSDNECLDRVELFIDGNLVRTEIVDPPGGTELDFTFNWNTLAFSNGSHQVRAVATDCAGNTAETTSTFIVDNLPSEVEIVDPPDESTIEGETLLEITAEDNECLDRVELYIDGNLVTTKSVVPETETSFFFDWDTTEYLEGPHEVTAIAFDCAGNIAETTNTYIVDNIPDNFVEELVNGDLKLPEEKPDIEQIVDFDVEIEVEEVFPFETFAELKVKVRGRVKIEISYVADVADDSQPVHSAHFTIPFSSLIKGINLGACISLYPVVILEHVQYHQIDARTIKKAIVFLVGVRTEN